MNNKLPIILVFLLSLSPLTVSAKQLTCGGTVKAIGFHTPNTILLRLSSMNTSVFVCNIASNWTPPGTSHTTSAEMCKAMLSMLLHAKATQADMGNVYFDGEHVPDSCDSWGSWRSANVRYFMY